MDIEQLRFASLPSTNAYFKQHWTEFGPFAFVRADFQSKGKGREDRSWNASAGENLLFSMLIKKKSLFDHVGLLSLGAALAVTKALEAFGVVDVAIKWPNDVYVSGKKICGILLEGQLPEYAIVGIGVNINQKPFAGEYRHPPTSMALELGKEIDIDALYAEVRKNLLSLFGETRLDGKKMLEEFEAYDFLKGKTVSRMVNGTVLEGTACGVDEEYRLILKIGDKKTLVYSGEIQ